MPVIVPLPKSTVKTYYAILQFLGEFWTLRSYCAKKRWQHGTTHGLDHRYEKDKGWKKENEGGNASTKQGMGK